MVEGAGDAFTYKTLKWRIICKVVSHLYKNALKIPKRVIFLNEDDKEEFIRRGLIDENKPFVLPGIGVNLEEFKCPSIGFNNCFLMIARLLPAKGVYEYLSAARIIKEKYPHVIFGLLGAEGSVTRNDIESYLNDGSVVYYGETDDVRPYLKNCSVFVLPSYYREGFPMSIMEAQACGRSVVTCDSVGCRDTVKDGYNGFLIEPKSVNALVEKLTSFIENPELAKTMGINARKYAEENFSHEHINEQIFDLTTKG
jgi:glycosyltransferase involved in cell wall biosynthesis